MCRYICAVVFALFIFICVCLLVHAVAICVVAYESYEQGAKTSALY